MTQHATIDFETYSEAGFEWDAANKKWTHPEGGSPTNRGLNLVGAVNYTRHPTFAVLCAWYRLPGGELTYWDPSMPPPQDLFDHVAAGGTVEAHNHAFERRVFEALGWPAVPLAQQRCSMAKGRAWALPGSLGDASAVTGTRAKNLDGKTGIQRFCVPQKPTKANGQKTRLTREDRPEEFQRLIVDYCADDVRAEEALSEITPELSPIELEHWFVDQTINSRGVAVDVPTLQAMREVLRDAQRVYGDRCRAITGGISPSEVSQLISWAAGHGVYFDALDDDALTEALERENLPQAVRAMLQCRAAVASASVKKVHAMLNRATTEGRIYDLFNFHAARTGRPTGDKVQPTNMPRGSSPVLRCPCGRWHFGETCPWCGAPKPPLNADGKPSAWSPEAMHDAIEIMQTGSLAMVERAYGDALTVMASCLRGMFVAAEGHDLVSSDYTAIEAVVLACLAGEQWRIDLFHAKGKIYEASGAKVGRVPYQTLIDYKKETGEHHPLRQVGKTAELGLGFMGWIGAWLAFDSSGDLSETEIKDIILKWRAENPAIVEFWGGQVRREGWNKRDDLHGVEGSFIQAAMRPGSRVEYRGLVFESRIPDFPARCPAVALSAPLTVSITLLSGRKLTYHNVLLEPTDRPWNGTYSVSYEGFNTNPKSGLRGWIRHRTHGGKLTENIVQATANDILRYALANLERAGYATVLHVYDEIVCEVPKGWGSVQELESIMADLPAWANGWPIAADGGWRGKRYRKG